LLLKTQKCGNLSKFHHVVYRLRYGKSLKFINFILIMVAAGFSHVRIKTNVRCDFQSTLYQKANSTANYDLRQDSTLMRQKNRQ
jgi:hypothetical protein